MTIKYTKKILHTLSKLDIEFRKNFPNSSTLSTPTQLFHQFIHKIFDDINKQIIAKIIDNSSRWQNTLNQPKTLIYYRFHKMSWANHYRKYYHNPKSSHSDELIKMILWYSINELKKIYTDFNIYIAYEVVKCNFNQKELREMIVVDWS